MRSGDSRLSLSTEQFLSRAKNKFCVLSQYKTADQIEQKIKEILDEMNYWKLQPTSHERRLAAKKMKAAAAKTNKLGSNYLAPQLRISNSSQTKAAPSSSMMEPTSSARL